MRGTTVPSSEHSLFSRQRTSSVERELASTPYAFTPKPIDDIQRAKETLLNPFEDDINVRLARQRLFTQTPPDLFKHYQDRQQDALSNISERLSETSSLGNLSRVNSEEIPFPSAPEVLPPIRAEVTQLSAYPKYRSVEAETVLVQPIKEDQRIKEDRFKEERLREERLKQELLEERIKPKLAETKAFYRSVETETVLVQPIVEDIRHKEDRFKEERLREEKLKQEILEEEKLNKERLIKLKDVSQESTDNSHASTDSDGLMQPAAEGREAFTILPAPAKSDDLDSVTSSVSFNRVAPIVRPHRVTAFAIVNESSEPGPPASLNEDVVIGVQAPSIVSSTGSKSSNGRVSPFRGKGFKADPYSIHTTPKTSTNTSPQRSRSNSMTRPSVSFERPLTPPRNYIRENIREVQELSNFNKERNEELAEQKKIEEELEILKELGLLSESNILKVGGTPKLDGRHKMASPSVMHYENLRSGMRSRAGDDPPAYSWKPTPRNASLLSKSKSQPQSKTGSPQHRSKIPKRQNSVSPPRKHEVMERGAFSVMSNVISPDGRFISNSTGSIYDNRVFSKEDYDVGPIFDERTKSRSRSSHNLPASILKSRPPKSPNNLGPPPTSKLNSKRLSPIAATPDNRSTAHSTPSRGGMKSKTPTPRVSSPSKIPKRPSKSLAASPSNSRAPSRNNLAESGKSSSTTKLTKTGQRTVTSEMSRRESKDSGKKPPLTRINSRASVTSKTSGGSKPDLKRMNSKTSMLSRTNSIMSMNEKLGTLRRKQSLKNLKESSIDEKSMKSEGRGGRHKSGVQKRDVSTSRSINDVELDIEKQDNETQYDKASNLDISMDKLIPLTKGNVVSMTTAAITSQPLDIAAKVTNQLPIALGKAREKREFDRNSSSDSIAATKMGLDASKTESDSDSKNLQKTASKSSLGHVKEEKESGSNIPSNMKLIPMDKVSLDPKLEKVKQKIDNILKSDQSSAVDLKDKVEKETEKVNSTLEKVAEKIEEEVKISTTTAVIEKVEEKKEEKKSLNSAASSIKAANSIKKFTDPLKEEVKKPEDKTEKSPPKETSTGLSGDSKLMGEKVVPPVEKAPSKPEMIKQATVETKPELVTVKESVVKKELLTPEVVNEKSLGKMDGGERVTEKIIKGGPDVEVQSGNVSPAMIKAKPSTSITNGTNGTSVSNGMTKLPHNDSKGSESIKTGKSILGSPTSGKIKDDIDVEKPPPDGKPENICKRFMGRCPQRMLCCGKKANASQLHLIDEKVDKKKKDKLESQPKDSKMSRLNCCGKKSDAEMMNISGSKVMEPKEEPTPGCMSCCKRKNKIRDSSADRRAAAPPKWYHKICCCGKKKQQDWAARRDSILSQPPSTGCCGGCMSRLLCCKKSSPQEDSRRTSLFSKKRSLSQAVPIEDSRPKLDPSLIEHSSHMRAAIPALPIPLAWICCICNVIIPGLGTILSGMFCLCFGRPRFGLYDGARPRIGAFMIDVFVGAGQLFTVLFCLVGWGWSIWWGTMMIKVARKYKKLRLAAQDPEKAQPNNHRARA